MVAKDRLPIDTWAGSTTPLLRGQQMSSSDSRGGQRGPHLVNSAGRVQWSISESDLWTSVNISARLLQEVSLLLSALSPGAGRCDLGCRWLCPNVAWLPEGSVPRGGQPLQEKTASSGHLSPRSSSPAVSTFPGFPHMWARDVSLPQPTEPGFLPFADLSSTPGYSSDSMLVNWYTLFRFYFVLRVTELQKWHKEKGICFQPVCKSIYLKWLSVQDLRWLGFYIWGLNISDILISLWEDASWVSLCLICGFEWGIY